jgi:hypothetical protein
MEEDNRPARITAKREQIIALRANGATEQQLKPHHNELLALATGRTPKPTPIEQPPIESPPPPPSPAVEPIASKRTSSDADANAANTPARLAGTAAAMRAIREVKAASPSASYFESREKERQLTLSAFGVTTSAADSKYLSSSLEIASLHRLLSTERSERLALTDRVQELETQLAATIDFMSAIARQTTTSNSSSSAAQR